MVCGEEDVLKPVRYSKLIADLVSDAEFVVIPDCGHAAVVERPDVVETLAIGFVVKNARRGAED